MSVERKITWIPEMLGLFGQSPPMREVWARIEILAKVDVPLLVVGEPGTGKEQVARAIHHLSARKERPFSSMVTGCQDPEADRRELFASRGGLAVVATGGTLYIDEIGRIDAAGQDGLVTMIEGSVPSPEGSEASVPSDCRLVFGTAMDPDGEALDPELRTRVAGNRIDLPPLRERPEDIAPIVSHYIRAFGQELDKPDLELDEDALRALEEREWRGNIRQLVAVVRRIVLGSVRPEVTAEAVGRALEILETGPDPTLTGIRPGMSLEEARARAVRTALRVLDGNVSRVARILGVDRRTVMKFRNRPESRTR